MLEDEVEEEEEEEESSEESADEPLDEEAERRDFVEALDDLTLRDFVEEAGDGEAGPSDDAALAPWASSSEGLGFTGLPGFMVEGARGLESASCKARSGF